MQKIKEQFTIANTV